MEETRGERGRGEKESKMSQKVTFDADFLKYTLQSTKSQTYTFKSNPIHYVTTDTQNCNSKSLERL